MNEEDDAWSYSFPPSTESLNNTKQTNVASLNDHLKNRDNSNDDNDVRSKDGEEQKQESNDPNGLNGSDGHSGLGIKAGSVSSSVESIHKLKDNLDSRNSILSQASSKSSHTGSIDFNRKEPFPSTNSAPQSLNSLSLQSPFLSKSSPANPLTTKEDANSVMSKESGSRNGLMNIDLNDNNNVVESLLESPPKRSSNLSNIRSNSNATISLDNHKRAVTESDINKDSDDPKFISYRRSRRTTSEGNFSDIIEPMDSPQLQSMEKFDTRLYIDEKFKDTKYRYTTMKRNTDFHQLFKSLDLTDRLLDDFSCALSREILLQGRIYVSENYVCFNSSLLGWVTNLIIPQEDIIKFEKRSTAGIFPNAILVETKDSKHTFASFISRDSTFDFMKTVWEGTTGKEMIIDDENKLENLPSSPKTNKRNTKMPNEPSKIESYLMSIDDDNLPENGLSDEDEDEDEDDDEEDEDDDDDDEVDDNNVDDNDIDDNLPKKLDSNNTRSSVDPNVIAEQNKVKIVRFKPESGYVNIGPDVHGPTNIPDLMLDGEIELCNEQINAPLGVVYEILFGSSNSQFQTKFLESHDSTNIVGFDKFHPKNDDPKLLHREYSYTKALGYSIGPKSTTCYVDEVINHLNFGDYIFVTSTTKTPDVPLGNSFTVKTIYRITWAKLNQTNLQVSFLIDWTGRSWIKSLIEKLTLTGQTDACNDMVRALKEEIDNVTISSYEQLNQVTMDDLEKTPEANVPEEIATSTTTETKSTTAFSSNEWIRNNIVSECYLIFSFLVMILIIQLMIFRSISETNSLMKSQVALNSNLIQVLSENNGGALKETDPQDLWHWVHEKYNLKFHPLQKLEYLSYHISSLFKEPEPKNESIEEQFNDLKTRLRESYKEKFSHIPGII